MQHFFTSILKPPSKKIILRLAGGLGNQLFQLAKAIQLTDDYKNIFISTQHLKKYSTYNDYVLPRIVNMNIFNTASKLDDFILSTRLPKIVNYSAFGVILASDNSKRLDGLKFRYLILDGYFQNEKYFKHYKDDI